MDDPFKNKQNVHISTEHFDRKMFEFSLLLYNNPLLSRKAVNDIFTINFYYSIFQFGEKRITLRIFVSKNTKLYNNDMKLQHSS